MSPEKTNNNPTFSWQSFKSEAKAAFDKTGFYSKKNEAWKYTSLRNLETDFLSPFNEGGSADIKADLTDSYFIAVINGVVDEAQSNLPAGDILQVISCDEGEIPEKYFEEVAGHKSFNLQPHVALNRANANQVIYLKLGKSEELDKPLEIKYFFDKNAQNNISTQLVVSLQENSGLCLLESFESESDNKFLHNHAAYIAAHKNSHMKHYKIQNVSDESYHLYNENLEMHNSSEYNSFSFYCGGLLSRQEVRANLIGSNIRCNQEGITLGQDKQHHDCFLPVFHAAPKSYSNQHFRQLLDDESKGIFYGTIFVPEDSIETEAHQLNRNLLLSNKAQAFTRPELDIHTDEVVCSHGATVGNLDETAMYYLLSRGLNKNEARSLLVQAFAAEMLDDIENEEVREIIKNKLESWTERHTK